MNPELNQAFTQVKINSKNIRNLSSAKIYQFLISETKFTCNLR